MLKYLFLISISILCFSGVSFCQKSIEPNLDFIKKTRNLNQNSSETEWKEIQETLTKYAAVYSGVNDKVTRTGMPDGPMSGNGNVGLVSAISKDWSRFYLTTNGFWTGKKFEVKPLPIGGVDIVVNGSSVDDLEQVQNMLDSEIKSTMNSKTIKIRTWVSATGDYLVSTIFSSSTKPINVP